MELAASGALLALSTMFLLMGAGTFAVLAVLVGTLPSENVRWRGIDVLTAIPSLAVVLGFATACFALQDHTSAVALLRGLDGAVRLALAGMGGLFAAVALAYGVVAAAGRLPGGLRRPLLRAVGVVAALFVAVLAAAQPSAGGSLWTAPATAVQTIGLALLGGSALATMMLESAGMLGGTAVRRTAAACAVAGAVLGAGGIVVQVAMAAGMAGGTGDELVRAVSTHLAVGLSCLAAALVFTLMAVRMKEAGYHSVIAVACAFVGVFCVRLVFYALQA